jgi:hypothetical protein
MKSVYIMLLLNSEDPLRKENAFKDGRKEIIKIGNSFDVKQRKIQIGVSHNNLVVEEIIEYPFHDYITIENRMHSEFEQYKEPITDKNGTNLTEYYKVNKETHNEICESLKTKCLKYLPELVSESNKYKDECGTLTLENMLLKNKYEDIKENFSILEKQRDTKQHRSIINKLLLCVFNDNTTNKEKTIIDALKLLEEP